MSLPSEVWANPEWRDKILRICNDTHLTGIHQVEIREEGQRLLTNFGGPWRAFEWNYEQNRHQLRGEVVGFENNAHEEGARREDGTAHGCLVAILVNEEGETNDPTQWELE